MAICQFDISCATRPLGVRHLSLFVRLALNRISASFRHYIGILRQENLLGTLQSRLEQLSSVYNFKPLELEPLRKDGGVFVRFSYTPSLSESLADGGDPLKALQNVLNEEANKHGGLPTWMGVGSSEIWIVRGSPWKEVCYPFNIQHSCIIFDQL